MNLNILNKITLLVFSTFLLKNFTYAQSNLISWEVADAEVNQKFIEAYLNVLIKNDKFDNNTIQSSDVIMVQMEKSDEGLSMKRLRAKNYDSGEFRRFQMDQVEEMSKSMLDEILDRKYKWSEITRRDLSEFESYNSVDNILQERSFKRARDAFWWSTSQVEVSPKNAFIRQKGSNQAFRMEIGMPDMGLHRQIFNNIILGLSNDISSTYVIVPQTSPPTATEDSHPLDGTFGFGFKFDTHAIGGNISYMDSGNKFKLKGVNTPEHMVIPSANGLLYWSNTFGLNNNNFITILGAIKDLLGRGGGESMDEKDFASLRLKVGMSLSEFIHASIDSTIGKSESQNLQITDRIIGTEALGFFVKAEIATDDKRTKLYGQSNTSFGGMSSISFGLEHNVYKSFNVGFDMITYPSGSGLEFDTKKSKNSSWTWYPYGEGGGSIFAPYLSIHF